MPRVILVNPFFADDNFGPATLARIAREPSPAKRRELERIRTERLRFFEEYDRAVPRDLCGLTQTTAEVVSDEEYLSAMYEKMRIRGVLVGIESYDEAGLKHANKLWNPVGAKMVDAVRQIQDHGILVLSSIICGLESDTLETLRTMRSFARESGTALVQYPVYGPFPGTVDFAGKLTYVFSCLAFRTLYPEGVAADNVRSSRVGWLERMAMRVVVLLSRRGLTSDLRAPDFMRRLGRA